MSVPAQEVTLPVVEVADGAAEASREAVRAMAEIATRFVEMDLHRTASAVVVRLNGAGAGDSLLAIERGHFHLDPCNLHEGEAQMSPGP